MSEIKRQDNVFLSSIDAMLSCGHRDLSDFDLLHKKRYVSSQTTTLRTFLLLAKQKKCGLARVQVELSGFLQQ